MAAEFLQNQLSPWGNHQAMARMNHWTNVCAGKTSTLCQEGQNGSALNLAWVTGEGVREENMGETLRLQ